jgi:hypothetical protein
MAIRDEIRSEVREKAENMDEGDLELWIESMLSEIEVLEIKREEVYRILVEREKKFLKHVAKQNEKETSYELTKEINNDELMKKRLEKSGIKFCGAYFCNTEENF